MVDALEDEDPLVRCYAAWGIGHLGGARFAPELARRAEAEDHDGARVGLFFALVLLTRRTEYLTELERIMTGSPDYRARCLASSSLLETSTVVDARRVRAALERALESEETVAVRDAIQGSLDLL